MGTLDVVAPAGIRPLLVATLAAPAPRGAGRPVLAVTATGREAEDLAAALRCFLPPAAVADFPAWETLPHERLSPRSDTVGRRLAVLRRLAHPEDGRGRACQRRRRAGPRGPAAAGRGPRRPRAGEAAQRGRRGPRGDGRGARRRGVHPGRPGRAARRVRGPRRHPRRLPADRGAPAAGRVLGRHGRGGPLVLGRRPAPPRGRRARAVGAALPRAAAHRRRCASAPARSPTSCPGVADMLGKLAEGIAVEGMESLAPVLVDEHGAAARPAARRHPRRAGRPRAGPHPRARPGRHQRGVPRRPRGPPRRPATTCPIDLRAGLAVDLATSSTGRSPGVREHAVSPGWPWWTLTPFGADAELPRPPTSRRRHDRRRARSPATAATPSRPSPTCAAWCRRRLARGRRHRGPRPGQADGRGARRRTTSPARLAASVDVAPEPAVVHVTTAPLAHGFVAEALRARAAHRGRPRRPAGPRPRDMRRLPSRRRNVDRPAAAARRRLRRARAARRRPVRRDGAAHRRRRDPRVPRHRVRRRASAASPATGSSCPTDQLDQVTRYVGGEAPPLDRLGGADWAKTQGPGPQGGPRDRRRADPALRRPAWRRPGYAFGPDTPWQRELEDAFPYVETPDQLTTHRRGQGRHGEADPDGPADLRRRRLRQDRDRGAGGVQGGAGRQAGRRARADDAAGPAAPADVHRAVRELPGRRRRPLSPVPDRHGGAATSSRGSRDGTRRRRDRHPPAAQPARSGSRTSAWSSSTRSSASASSTRSSSSSCAPTSTCSSMSATPIPRTLEMAVTGIREMSTIATPPEERHPVLTFVGAYDEKQITAAIRRELLREGQVFYVHNRVESIERAAARLRELVPEARIATAHGQMGEHQLEQVDARLLGEAVRRAGLHDDRRDRPRHLQRQHPDRRAGRHCSACPSCTSCAAGSAAAASAPTPTSSTRRRSR